eukprot:6179376-Pleurochrysis_carterae.AAC.1
MGGPDYPRLALFERGAAHSATAVQTRATASGAATSGAAASEAAASGQCEPAVPNGEHVLCERAHAEGCPGE